MNPQANTQDTTTARWWFVRSERPDRKHLFYRISIDPRTGLYVCECPDHVNRYRDCKHNCAVQAGGGIVAKPVRRTKPAGKNWTAVRPVPAAPKPQPSQAVRDLADSLQV
jgi:hypothetical protein